MIDESATTATKDEFAVLHLSLAALLVSVLAASVDSDRNPVLVWSVELGEVGVRHIVA